MSAIHRIINPSTCLTGCSILLLTLLCGGCGTYQPLDYPGPDRFEYGWGLREGLHHGDTVHMLVEGKRDVAYIARFGRNSSLFADWNTVIVSAPPPSSDSGLRRLLEQERPWHFLEGEGHADTRPPMLWFLTNPMTYPYWLDHAMWLISTEPLIFTIGPFSDKEYPYDWKRFSLPWLVCDADLDREVDTVIVITAPYPDDLNTWSRLTPTDREAYYSEGGREVIQFTQPVTIRQLMDNTSWLKDE